MPNNKPLSFLKSVGIFILPFVLFSSCCNNEIEQIHETNNWEFSLNKRFQKEKQNSVTIGGLKIKLKSKKLIDHLYEYEFLIAGEPCRFYSYNDDIYTWCSSYGKRAAYLSRGAYTVRIGDPNEVLFTSGYPTYSIIQVHKDYPLYGIAMSNCTEESGVITGEIKLGADIPKYSSLKFTLVEKEDGVVLKRVSLER